MVLSNRTKEIIRLILNQKGYITVEEIANKMDISPRTTYRELPEVSEVMEQYGVALITASKKGVAASGNPEDVKRLRAFLGELEEVIIVNPEERADYVLLYLLQQEDYVKMEAVAIDHQCALTTIRNDLGKAKQRVNGYDLKLVQQKGQGVKITGTFMEKSHLITDVLLRWAEESMTYCWLEGKKTESNPFLNRLEEYDYKGTMCQMHSCLNEVLSKKFKLLNSLKTREYLEIVFLLSFMIYYHKQGQIYKQYVGSALEGRREQELYRQILKYIKVYYLYRRTNGNFPFR